MEHDLRQMGHDNSEEQGTNYDQKMYQLKEKEFDQITSDRHKFEMAELLRVKAEKDLLMDKWEAEEKETDAKLLGKADYQKAKDEGV